MSDPKTDQQRAAETLRAALSLSPYFSMLPLHSPTTGVVNVNNLEWIYEDTERGINISYEEALAYHLAEQGAAWVNNQDDPNVAPDDDLIEMWTDEFNEFYEEQGDTYLVGDWVKDDASGKYDPDPALPKDGYAAIVSFDSNVAQVVLSKWVTFGHYCSPCYPNQVDLDNAGEYLGYDFPADMYGSSRQNPNPVEEYKAGADHAE